MLIYDERLNLEVDERSNKSAHQLRYTARQLALVLQTRLLFY